jgi:hypothetical protein
VGAHYNEACGAADVKRLQKDREATGLIRKNEAAAGLAHQACKEVLFGQNQIHGRIRTSDV